MTKKSWIVFITVCVLLFAGLFVYSKKDAVDVSTIDASKINTGTNESGGLKDVVFGNVNAKVTLIEYGDYQCPACHKIYPTVKALTEENKDSLRFVFRNFPISDLHPNARAAAASAEAASIEGKFWEMHNGLYEQYDSWANASADKRTEALTSIATSVGLDKTKFLALLEDRSSDINKKINFDRGLGTKIGVTGTPTFVLNGRLLTSDELQTVDSLKKLVSDEIAKNK